MTNPYKELKLFYGRINLLKVSKLLLGESFLLKFQLESQVKETEWKQNKSFICNS